MSSPQLARTGLSPDHIVDMTELEAWAAAGTLVLVNVFVQERRVEFRLKAGTTQDRPMVWRDGYAARLLAVRARAKANRAAMAC